MVKIMKNPIKMDDLGGFPLFLAPKTNVYSGKPTLNEGVQYIDL